MLTVFDEIITWELFEEAGDRIQETGIRSF